MNKLILVLGLKSKDTDLSDVSDVPDIKTVVVVDNADSGILLIIRHSAANIDHDNDNSELAGGHVGFGNV